mgnify:CR=1 FL=1
MQKAIGNEIPGRYSFGFIVSLAAFGGFIIFCRAGFPGDIRGNDQGYAEGYKQAKQ